MAKKKGNNYVLPIILAGAVGLGALALVNAQPKTGCTVDADCPSGQTCVNGTCTSPSGGPSGTIEITVTPARVGWW